jgi:signal peptidase II
MAVFAILALMVVILDRLTKAAAIQYLSDGHAQPFIPGVLDFQLVFNEGAAWGIFAGARYAFVALALVAIVVVLVYLVTARPHATITVLALGLLIGGAIGNAVDRFQTGRVVDFIHPLFIDFPLFNIADSAITCGIILLAVAILFSKPEQKPKD